MQFKYNFWGNVGEYTANIENTVKGIQVSNVSKYKSSAEEVVGDMLVAFVPPYSGISTRNEKGKKELKIKVEEKIIALKDEIKKLELISKICSRKKIFFKEE